MAQYCINYDMCNASSIVGLPATKNPTLQGPCGLAPSQEWASVAMSAEQPLLKQKIFGIGLSRTGTLSLTVALRALGYHSIHTPISEEAIQRADALTDSPISFRFEQLDSQFQGARFIQTLRDLDSWMESCRNRFSKPPPSRFFRCIRMALYGCEMFDETAFRDAYHRFNERVDRYFKSRPGMLLQLNIFEAPDPWAPLCAFLQAPRPEMTFPHENKRRKNGCSR
jgi:hypothetical protein